MANELILRLDVAQESRSLSIDETTLRHDLKLWVLGLASLERTIARKRALVAGLRDGDANSQFYRILASKRRHGSHIERLSVDDQVVSDQDAKEELAKSLYMGLLWTAQPREHELSLEAIGLSLVELAGLEAQISEEEAWEAVRVMRANKSPGTDGLSCDFYKFCWPTVKMDVTAALQAVWLGRHHGFDRLNVALIMLLPKKEGAVDLKDFRPISLVHSFARLLTKVIARWLAPHMLEFVDDNQTAFIRGRSIQDNFTLVHEFAKKLSSMKQPSILLKVDIAKAFDNISWPFLLSVL
jgi:mannosylglycoprotein endo-beta-mannosidase